MSRSKKLCGAFRQFINGEMDDYPEAAFLMASTMDDVMKKAKQIENV